MRPCGLTESKEISLEEKQKNVRKLSEERAKVFSELVGIHLQTLTKVMMSNNGVSELQKRQANKALVEAVQFALDFGVGVTNANIRDRGTVLAQETNNLAGVLVQALDNRMILLADNLRQQQEAEVIASQQTTEEQSQTQGE